MGVDTAAQHSSTAQNLSSDGNDKSECQGRVRVIVRVRPHLGDENRETCIYMPTTSVEGADGAGKEVIVRDDRFRRQQAEELHYKVDGCYDCNASTKQIFDHEVKSSVPNVFRGKNTTIFAHGVTGSGKTHTMQGSDGDGIIPLMVRALLDRYDQHQVDLGLAMAARPDPSSEKPWANQDKGHLGLSMSYLEIYNERVYDLLETKDKELPVRCDPSGNIVIPDLAKKVVDCYGEFSKMYTAGCRNRVKAQTKLNSQSSRSHAVLMLRMRYRELEYPYRIRAGKVHLIDLAGSEDNRKTGNEGSRLAESANINKSLFVLSKVIDSLNDSSARVPYRDSKLTRLLQDSLGGSSNALMIVNLAPGVEFFQHTYHTLQFASKSRHVIGKVQNSSCNSGQGSDHDPMWDADTSRSSVEEEQISRKEKLSNWKKKSAAAPSVGEKRPHSTELSHTNRKPFAPVDPNIQTQLKKLQKKQEMLSPLIKRQRKADSDTLARIERLERELLDAKKKQTAVVAPPTTSSKEKAKEYLEKGKKLKGEGQLEKALPYYKRALALVPDNEKLQKAVKKLESSIKSDTSVKHTVGSGGGFGLKRPSETLSGPKKKSKLGTMPAPTIPSSAEPQALKRIYEQMKKEVKNVVEADILAILNSGERTRLQQLAGVGAKRADAIFDHWDENGDFSELSDLKDVKGFTDKMIAKIRDAQTLKMAEM